MANNGFPSMTALLGLLAVAGYQNRDKLSEWFGGSAQPNPQASGMPAGLDRIFGSGQASTAGGIGGLLSSGLGELVERFRSNGQAKAVDSWVSTGPNYAIGDSDLEQAIGPDVLDALEQRTGLSRPELLARLAQRLPSAIDQYTPQGRL